MFMLLCFSATGHADVVYEKFDLENDDASYITIEIDSDGNFTQTSSIEVSYLFNRFSVLDINGKSIIITYNDVYDDNDTPNTNEVIIAIYDVNDLSKPMATKKFSGEKRPYEYGNPAVWGNNILIPCYKNTIIEINPETCSIINTYTHNEAESMYKLYDITPGPARVNVYNNKIYATFDSVMYDKLNISNVVSVADGGTPTFAYTVEMSSLGKITAEMSKLHQASLGYNLRTVDGNLYDNYFTTLQNKSLESGLYRFKTDVAPDTADKITFPSGTFILDTRTRTYEYATGQEAICSDGNGGLYFIAYDTNISSLNSKSSEPFELENVKDIAIYHYNDDTGLKKVYTMLTANDLENNITPVSRIRYDRQSDLVFVGKISSTEIEMNIDGENVKVPKSDGKLIALKPDSSGNLTVVREFENAFSFEAFETSEKSNNNNEKKESVTPNTEKEDSSSGSGGCNLGWGVIYASSFFVMRSLKKLMGK